jgi:hypothetical protein
MMHSLPTYMPHLLLCIQDVAEALRRLPAQEVIDRNARLKRAMDLSLKGTFLPKELQEQQTPFNHYLRVRQGSTGNWSGDGWMAGVHWVGVLYGIACVSRHHLFPSQLACPCCAIPPALFGLACACPLAWLFVLPSITPIGVVTLFGFVCHFFFAGYNPGGEGREAGAGTAGHRCTLPAHHPMITPTEQHRMLGQQLQQHAWIHQQQLLALPCAQTEVVPNYSLFQLPAMAGLFRVPKRRSCAR